MYLHKTIYIFITGTVRKNQKGMPKLTSRLKIGQTENEHTRNILGIKWKIEEMYTCCLKNLNTKW